MPPEQNTEFFEQKYMNTYIWYTPDTLKCSYIFRLNRLAKSTHLWHGKWVPRRSLFEQVRPLVPLVLSRSRFSRFCDRWSVKLFEVKINIAQKLIYRLNRLASLHTLGRENGR